ncbi:MerR family transcriptional regulator [Ectobacillus funiculus]|uniref:MerR family transcriptional regulator n=1 Tax=Ectobacillus funiculus TaxID=137993 RepID=UPI00397CFF05
MNITEVSKLKNVSADTLRWYERVGLIPPVPRTSGGKRDYGEAELQWIDLIVCLRAAGIPVESLIEYNRLFFEGNHTVEARKELLIEARDNLRMKLEEIQYSLTKLEGKIKNYDKWLNENTRADEPEDVDEC